LKRFEAASGKINAVSSNIFKIPSKVQSINLSDNLLTEFFDFGSAEMVDLRFNHLQLQLQDLVLFYPGVTVLVDPEVGLQCALRNLSQNGCMTSLVPSRFTTPLWGVSFVAVSMNLICAFWLKACNKKKWLKTLLCHLRLSNALSCAYCFGLLISDARSNPITYMFQWSKGIICRSFRITSSVFIVQNHLLMVLIMIEKSSGVKRIRPSRKLEQWSTALVVSTWLLCVSISTTLELCSYLGEDELCFAFASGSEGAKAPLWITMFLFICCNALIWLLFLHICYTVYDMKRNVKGQVSGAIRLYDVILSTCPFILNNTVWMTLYVAFTLNSGRSSHHQALIFTLQLSAALNPFCHTFLSKQFIDYVKKM
jgi:hypothetical protein